MILATLLLVPLLLLVMGFISAWRQNFFFSEWHWFAMAAICALLVIAWRPA